MNKNATRPPLIKAMTDENIIIKGALITMRIHIWKDCWTLPISVVSLVTSDEGWNLSILANENDWIFLYKSLRRFVANPTDAFPANLPPRIPHVKESIAMTTIAITRVNKLTWNGSLGWSKNVVKSFIELIFMLVSKKTDIVKGIALSSNTSSIIKIGVIIAYILYCLTLFKINLILFNMLSPFLIISSLLYLHQDV